MIGFWDTGDEFFLNPGRHTNSTDSICSGQTKIYFLKNIGNFILMMLRNHNLCMQNAEVKLL